ncbi:MAG: hypothetical protein WCJ06_17040 [Planctomycetota bacterium]
MINTVDDIVVSAGVDLLLKEPFSTTFYLPFSDRYTKKWKF